MNALLDAGEPENYVYLNLSGTHGLSHVEEATVNLYINGKLVEKAEELPPLKPIGSPARKPRSAARARLRWNPLRFLLF